MVKKFFTLNLFIMLLALCNSFSLMAQNDVTLNFSTSTVSEDLFTRTWNIKTTGAEGIYTLTGSKALDQGWADNEYYKIIGGNLYTYTVPKGLCVTKIKIVGYGNSKGETSYIESINDVQYDTQYPIPYSTKKANSVTEHTITLATPSKTVRLTTLKPIGAYVVLTVEPAGISKECILTKATFGNFNSFINETTKVVNVYYNEKEGKPPAMGLFEVSDGATAIYDASTEKIKVTAEDGVTFQEYTVTINQTQHYTMDKGETFNFDGTEYWLHTGNSYVTERNGKVINAYVLAKMNANNESMGKTRAYLYLPACSSIVLTTTQDANCNINVKVNGVIDESLKTAPTNGTITINADNTKLNIIEINNIDVSSNLNIQNITINGYTPASVDNIIDNKNQIVDVYSIQGILLRNNVDRINATNDLAPGIYIIDRQKIIITK